MHTVSCPNAAGIRNNIIISTNLKLRAMKTKVIYFVIGLTLLNLSSVLGQVKTEKFIVAGNCGMCENRIEKAAKSVDGVTAADWSKETKFITVSIDTLKTKVQKVYMAIAKVGHDTEIYKAKDETYKALPGCCRYERTIAKKEEKKEK